MTKTWQRVEELLDQALRQSPEARQAFLDAVCDGQPALQSEVASLIAADGAAGDFLHAPLHAPETLLENGKRLGRYQILDRLGQGATGTVYLARRCDDHFERRVAIKVLRGGLDNTAFLRRFQREQQILASLDHPNLARLYDAGTEEGWPYFVMEYIEGSPVDTYCDQARLSVRERVELFCTVCSAVHHAHQNLIVHRDLKPGNILVTTEGVPKLLDFGIAKLLKPNRFGRSEPTAAWVRIMTPQYASLEQVLGQPITTASDVYALGVLLYKLLSGRLPHNFDQVSLEEFARVLGTDRPPKPSAVAELASPKADAAEVGETPHERERVRGIKRAALRHQLDGDLDDIVMKALRKEPQRRYASAEQLAEDLRRYLNGLPVAARGDSFRYRAGKLVRRHRLATATAAAVLALVLGSASTIAVQSARVANERDRAEAARDRARTERDRAESMLGFVSSLFDLVNPNQPDGRLVTAREILDRGAERIRDELGGQDPVSTALLSTIGSAYCQLGLYEQGIPLLKEALETGRRDSHHTPLEIAALADALGAELADSGDPQGAEALHLEVLEIYRRHHDAEHPEVATALAHLAEARHGQGRFEEAQALFERGLAMRRRLLEPNHPSILHIVNELGLLAIHQGQLERAERFLREALAMHPDHGERPTANLVAVLSNLAQVLYETGDLAGAEEQMRHVLSANQRLLGVEHPNVAQAFHNLGNVIAAQGRDAEAEPLTEKALSMWRRVYDTQHPNIASALGSLGSCAYRQGQYERAADFYRRSEKIYRQVLGDDHPQHAYSLFLLGRLETDRGDVGAAEAHLRQALEIWSRKLPPEHWWIARGESVLGACLTRQGRFDEAMPLLTAGLPRIAAQVGAEDRETHDAKARLIAFYEASARFRQPD